MNHISDCNICPAWLIVPCIKFIKEDIELALKAGFSYKTSLNNQAHYSTHDVFQNGSYYIWCLEINGNKRYRFLYDTSKWYDELTFFKFGENPDLLVLK